MKTLQDWQRFIADIDANLLYSKEELSELLNFYYETRKQREAKK